MRADHFRRLLVTRGGELSVFITATNEQSRELIIADSSANCTEVKRFLRSTNERYITPLLVENDFLADATPAIRVWAEGENNDLLIPFIRRYPG